MNLSFDTLKDIENKDIGKKFSEYNNKYNEIIV